MNYCLVQWQLYTKQKEEYRKALNYCLYALITILIEDMQLGRTKKTTHLENFMRQIATLQQELVQTIKGIGLPS